MSPAESGDDTGVVLPGGVRISAAVADEAAEWFTQLMGGAVASDDLQRCQQWREAHPDHERAWQHLQGVAARLRNAPRGAVRHTLLPGDNGASAGRRKAMRSLLVLATLAGGGVLATRSWQQRTADYRTATGQRREVVLDDGTRLLLDAASAADVRYDAQQRHIRLIAGAVCVTSAQAITGVRDARPLVVQTDEGRIRALGTRFIVRQGEGRTGLAVLQDAVQVTPADAPQRAQVVGSGQQLSFSRAAVDTSTASSLATDAWTRGELVADHMRLDAFLAELSRYRPGLLRCAPEVAALRFSGVFPLDDTDRILALLPRVLPVQVRQRHRYWTVVEPG